MSIKSIENGNLNLNNLDVSTINGSAYPPVSGAGTLSDVLTAGNSAGLTSINMNGQDITGVDDIALTTINGSAYPPSSSGVTSVFYQTFQPFSYLNTSSGAYQTPLITLGAGTYLVSSAFEFTNGTTSAVSYSYFYQVGEIGSSTSSITISNSTFSQPISSADLTTLSGVIVLTATQNIYINFQWNNGVGFSTNEQRITYYATSILKLF